MTALEYQVACPVTQLLGLCRRVHANGNGDIDPSAEHKRCQHSSTDGDRCIRDIVIDARMCAYTQLLGFPGGGSFRSLVVSVIDKAQSAILCSLPSLENSI